jgi:DNA processing protein
MHPDISHHTSQAERPDGLSREHRRTLLRLLLALRSLPGLSPVQLRRRIHEYLSNGCRSDELSTLSRQLTATLWHATETELTRAEDEGVQLISVFDSEYPCLLRNLPDPPAVLYVRGNLPLTFSVAIVGTRRASAYGLSVAEHLGMMLARLGIPVVSGLAYGIDAAAHRGALRATGGSGFCSAGIAVLGSGVLNVTPAGNRALAAELLRCNGACISEYGLSAAAAKHHFPERNRLISGLAELVIVVEAEERSGALITARLALEQGKDLFAVPGNITSKSSRGTNRLLRDGAAVLTEVDDIFNLLPASAVGALTSTKAEATNRQAADTALSQLSTAARRLLSLFTPGTPYDFDELMKNWDLSPSALGAALSELEIDQLIRRHEEGHYLLNQMVDMG